MIFSGRGSAGEVRTLNKNVVLAISTAICFCYVVGCLEYNTGPVMQMKKGLATAFLQGLNEFGEES